LNSEEYIIYDSAVAILNLLGRLRFNFSRKWKSWLGDEENVVILSL